MLQSIFRKIKTSKVVKAMAIATVAVLAIGVIGFTSNGKANARAAALEGLQSLSGDSEREKAIELISRYRT